MAPELDASLCLFVSVCLSLVVSLSACRYPYVCLSVCVSVCLSISWAFWLGQLKMQWRNQWVFFLSEFVGYQSTWRGCPLLTLRCPTCGVITCFSVIILIRRRRRRRKSLKLVLRQPWVWIVWDFIFLASAYEGGLALPVTVLFHAVSSAHWLFVVSVLIRDELTRGHRWSRNLESHVYPGADLNTRPLDWQLSTLTTGVDWTTTLVNKQISIFLCIHWLYKPFGK